MGIMENESLLKRHVTFATWIVLLSMVLFATTSNVVFGSLGRVSESFGVPSELFSVTVSVQFLGFFVTCLFLGILSDRFGKKRMLIGACISACLGAFGWVLAPGFVEPLGNLIARCGFECSREALSVFSVTIGALLLGAGGGVMESMGAAILTDLHPDRSKYYMNVSQVAYCVGAILPTVAIGKLYPMGVSWKWAFGVTSAGSLLMALLCLPLCLPKMSQGREGHGDFKSTLRVIPSVAVPSICCFCYVFPEMATATFLGIYLKNHLHAPEAMSIYCLPMFWTAVIIGRMACAYLPQKQRYEYVISAFMLLASFIAAAQLWVTTWQVSMVLFVLIGFAFSGTWPMIVSLASTRNLEDSGTAAGITISTGSLGCILHPIVLGPLFHSGNIMAVFCILSGVLLFWAVLMFISSFWYNSPRKEEKQ